MADPTMPRWPAMYIFEVFSNAIEFKLKNTNSNGSI
jgi:hypothetical protein